MRGESGGTHGAGTGGDQGGRMGECEGSQHKRVFTTRPNGSVPGIPKSSVKVLRKFVVAPTFARCSPDGWFLVFASWLCGGPAVVDRKVFRNDLGTTWLFL